MDFVILKGLEIDKFLNDVIDLRIKVFREYPYLYDGNLEYEREYFKDFIKDSTARVILVKDADKVVAVATSIALSNAHLCDDTHKPFVEKGYDVERFYYYGEIMIDQDYRNQGISKQIYQLREKEAKSLGFDKLCFATIIKDSDNIPADYFDPNKMWKSMGFVERLDMRVECSWPKIQADGSTKEQTSGLNFWIKEF
ncbi:hypothetical protein LO80_04300 [Candidatus Francisella endociliophora]|uniref:N-acetyltransferase domain-containing protein n=1 Tax=Candidatus Francisella endociliophora TaxID=653937 RepID=A0A097ENX5_9GAMM|nr:GNAT family N-acetyltransferase [Francisella sp. FSC1006]AIT09265.1 hypothetical protein LO80_04300 [Francisella sp. FSC1006]